MKPHNSGFNMLSSIPKLTKSVMRKIRAPTPAMIRIFSGDVEDSKMNRDKKATINEVENPARYPIIVLLLFLGKW